MEVTALTTMKNSCSQEAWRKSAFRRHNSLISSGIVEKSQQFWTTISFSQATKKIFIRFFFFSQQTVATIGWLYSEKKECRGLTNKIFPDT